MTNPYEPLIAATTQPPRPRNNRFYSGGFLGIATIGIVIGGIVGASILGVTWQSAIPVFCIPALGWLCAIGVLTSLIRNTRVPFSGRVLLTLLASIPAYVLYVPVCGVVSMTTTPFLGGKDYGPTTAGAIIGSAVAFFVILMTIAVIVRAVLRKRDSTSQAPLDEQV